MNDDEREEVARRVSNSNEVLGHPHNHHPSTPTETPVTEGEHFDVLAHTHWGDYFVPTVVSWANGETDRFDDLETSLENRTESKAIVDGKDS